MFFNNLNQQLPLWLWLGITRMQHCFLNTAFWFKALQRNFFENPIPISCCIFCSYSPFRQSWWRIKLIIMPRFTFLIGWCPSTDFSQLEPKKLCYKKSTIKFLLFTFQLSNKNAPVQYAFQLFISVYKLLTRLKKFSMVLSTVILRVLFRMLTQLLQIL